MAAALRPVISFKPPDVSQADIESFHAAHFSSEAVGLFGSQFLRPESAQHYEEAEDDELGYYPDGAKRTLTDEQIAIFRHSELEALRRSKSKAVQPETTDDAEVTINRTDMEISKTPAEDGKRPTNQNVTDETPEGSEDGEIETEKAALTKAEIRRQKKLRARQRRKDSQKFQPEKKPDLRKRTWDVVEAGMDSLDYDDFELPQDHGAAATAQRKQISYDD
ncbi:hypothetical protein F5Y19DRAFT_478340 [Xylariaceae sp. FL1651]|nr:hypothetical protein F5Y19DRAFT_478340 [Xylariaceae sp. FL1651]